MSELNTLLLLHGTKLLLDKEPFKRLCDVTE